MRLRNLTWHHSVYCTMPASDLQKRTSPTIAGRAWSSGDLTFEAVEVPPNFQLTGHDHDRPHVCAVLAGAFDESEGRGRTRCLTGTTRASPAGDRHTLAFGDDGATCLIVTVDDACLIETRSVFRERTFFHQPWLAAIAEQAYRALQQDHATDALTLECLGWELIAQLERHGRSRAVHAPPIWLRRVRDRLRDLLSGTLSMRALAADAGVSREHLARAFRLHYGMSAEAFQRSARLDVACRRLVTTGAPVSAIAAECGFADQSHLTRWCVRTTGLTPAAIRRAGHHVTCVQDLPLGVRHTGSRDQQGKSAEFE